MKQQGLGFTDDHPDKNTLWVSKAVQLECT